MYCMYTTRKFIEHKAMTFEACSTNEAQKGYIHKNITHLC